MGNPFDLSAKPIYLELSPDRDFARNNEQLVPAEDQLSPWIFENEVHVVCELAESISSPRSLCVYLLCRYEQWDQLVNLPIDPMDYLETDKERFRDDYLVTSILKKSPRVPLDIDRKKIAFDKFREAEAACAKTNEVFRSYRSGKILPMTIGVERVIHKARDLINEILGDLTSSDLEFITTAARFGPGATSSVSGPKVCPSEKFLSRTDATPRMQPYVPHLLGQGSWLLASKPGRTVEHSELHFVPKNAKTDRSICIEPHMNIFLQLGIGTALKERLRTRCRLDLSTSWERNQLLAQKAYEKRYATIDLSSASDTIASELVEYLLSGGCSHRWKELLYLCKTDCTKAPNGEMIRLEKWSSMGNGYTFELETLIFLSLVRAVVPPAQWHECTVFGDDIILPDQYVPLLKSALEFCGFSVNIEKSFWQGVFFESCGKDFFAGQEVRPFYFKGDYVTKDDFFIKTANKIRRWSHNPSLGCCDQRLFSVWFRLFRRASDKAQRCRIPDGFGDSGFIGNFDESSARIRSVRSIPISLGWEGFAVNTLQFRPVAIRASCWRGYMTASLHSLEYRGSPSSLIVNKNTPLGDCLEIRRSARVVPQYTTSLVPYWPDLGPWM